MTFKHSLGDKAKDKISGMTGIITPRAEHLYGCARYWLSPQETKDGKPVDGYWFDEDGIDILEVGVIERREYRVVPAEPSIRHRGVVARAVERIAGGPTDQPSSATRSSAR